MRRRPDARRRSVLIWRTAIVLAAVVAASWLIRDTVTRVWPDGGAPIAVLLAFQGPTASTRAELALSANDTVGAAAAARQALEAQPGDAAALRTLALALDASGDPRGASELMISAAQWGWRDTDTQAWLFGSLIAAARDREAIIHGEALVARRQMTAEVFAQFVRMAADGATQDALIEALRRGTHWRSAFFQYQRSTPDEQLGPMANFLARLPSQGIPVSTIDAEPLVERLVAAGQAGRGRELWGSLQGVGVDANVTDGGFERFARSGELSATGASFGWRTGPLAEVYVVADPETKRDAVVLLAETGEPRDPLLAQRLALPAGSWILSYRVRSPLDDPAVLRIRVSCSSLRGATLAEEPLADPRTGWHARSLLFEVPGKCQTQWLQVTAVGLPPGAALGTHIDRFEVNGGP